MSKPISPDEIGKAQVKALPKEVFEAFNYLIAKHFDNGSAEIKQDDAVAEIARRMNFDDPRDVYRDKLLNVEEAYREAGWDVRYDKPGYNESYGAFFVFKRK